MDALRLVLPRLDELLVVYPPHGPPEIHIARDLLSAFVVNYRVRVLAFHALQGNLRLAEGDERTMHGAQGKACGKDGAR